MLKDKLVVDLNEDGSRALEAIMSKTGLKRSQVIHQVLGEYCKRINAENWAAKQGSVKSEPEPQTGWCMAKRTDAPLGCVLIAGHTEPHHDTFGEWQPASEVEEPREINETYARLNPSKCPVLEREAGKKVRLCDMQLCGGACPIHGEIKVPEVEEQAKPQVIKADRLQPCSGCDGTICFTCGGCHYCERLASDCAPAQTYRQVAERDPEAEQQAVEARKGRKAARAGRKANLQEVVDTALAANPCPHPNRSRIANGHCTACGGRWK